MKRKETYLSRDFRETAALRFPAQAKELNTAFDMRLSALLVENADREDRIWRQTMKYMGMPMGMWVLMKELGLYDLTPALCHLDYTMSEAGGVTDFVRQYTLASGGPYCDCGYKKKGDRKTISHLPRSTEQEPHAQQERKEDQVG